MCLTVPREVLEIQGDDPLHRLGRVAFAAEERMVNLTYAPDAGVGDYVVVHAGFAIAVIDAAEARATLALLADFAPQDPA